MARIRRGSRAKRAVAKRSGRGSSGFGSNKNDSEKGDRRRGQPAGKETETYNWERGGGKRGVRERMAGEGSGEIPG